MKANLNPEEWIENFLDGTLTDQEVQQFNEKVAADPKFAKLYNERLRLKDAWVKAHHLDETRKEVKKAIQREKSHRRMQTISIAAAAAVIILITIPALLYFNGDFKHQPTVADKTIPPDSLNEIIGKPQFKTAEEKAAYGIADSLQLIAPVNDQQFSRNDSVVFRWSPALKDSTYIVIQNGKSDQPAYKEKVAKGKDKFVLDKGFLPEGHYEWYIEGMTSVGKFRITR